MRAIFLPRDGARRQRTHAVEQSGTRAIGRGLQPADCTRRSWKTGHRVRFPVPSLAASLWVTPVSCLQSARQPSRPTGTRRPSSGERNNTTCQAGTVPLSKCGYGAENFAHSQTLTSCPTCRIFRAMTATLTTAEAANKLGCSERTIRYMITRGTIHATKIDPTAKSVYSISQDEVKRILELRSRSRNHKSRAATA